jgi:pimeloyl-ACP methyl ester carboxylesterase
MQRFRASDGAELAFAEGGSGTPPLAFVHGWQADHAVWRGTIDALGPNVHTLAMDLRGSGESRSADGPYRLERFAADLHELVDWRNLGPVVVVGHSMGGTLALRYALEYPQATSALVLVAPVPASGGGYSPKGEAYLRATAGNPVAARDWLARTLTNPNDEAILGPLCEAAARTERAVALESFESWAFSDFAEETRKIEAPVLVIAPEHDAPEVNERNVAALLPNARFVILPDSTHYAIAERPKAIADLIRRFIVHDPSLT